MKIIEKLLLVLIFLAAFDVMINLVQTLGLAMLAYEVKPLINEVKAELSGFEMPDFSSVNEVMRKFEPILELAEDLSATKLRYYFREGMNFLERCDAINCADLMIYAFPGWSKYYANESCRSE